MEEIFKIHFRILETVGYMVFVCFLNESLNNRRKYISAMLTGSHISIITAIFESPMIKASSFLWIHSN